MINNRQFKKLWTLLLNKDINCWESNSLVLKNIVYNDLVWNYLDLHFSVSALLIFLYNKYEQKMGIIAHLNHFSPANHK